ncbi:MAG: hypoxanthine phosphoribosyltransferase [Bacteroidota bacterium]|nr:hypoxanthine phosphoribosyltransferase [Bacteroidota bacterium]
MSADAIQVLDKVFVPFISEETIKHKISQLAEQINKEYAGKSPLFVAILNGSFMFASDLFKKITIDAEICFIKLASYKGTQSTGHIITSIGLDANITGRHIIIVEDIIDTGRTMHSFLPQITNQQPLSMKVATLLHKPEATEMDVPVDYCCFSIPNKFVIGYGLDYDGYGRNLPEIYQLRSI